MQIDGTFPRSRVARRVFLSFMACAFLPVAVLGVLSHQKVSDFVHAQEQRRVAQISSAYMHTVYERLLGARFVFETLARMHGSEAPQFDLRAMVEHSAFSDARVWDEASLHDAQNGLDGAQPPRIDAAARALLAKGEVVLLPAQGASGGMPWLARAVDRSRVDAGVVAAQLDSGYLWGRADDLSHGAQACVLVEPSAALRCTDPQVAPVARELASGAHGVVGVSSDGGWWGVTHSLFLRPKFGASDWQFVTVRPYADSSTAAESIIHNVFMVAGLAIALVGFLSLLQIRRTLIPIEALVEGTRRIAEEKFDQPVQVQGGDEFGQLAQALNGMSARLGRQIGAMRALSAIDAEILSNLDLNEIVARVDTRVAELIPDSTFAVVIPDTVSESMATVYTRTRASTLQRRRLEILGEKLAGVLHGREGHWLVPGAAESGLDALRAELAGMGGLNCAYAVPVIWRERVCGALIVGRLAHGAIDPDLTTQLRDLGDRIAVALAARGREEELIFRANHDELTALPNRRQLHEVLTQAVARAQRNKGRLAVLYIDMDRFKAVNDSLGHEAGDSVLRSVGERLARCVREADTVARIGGDEYVVVLPAIDSPKNATRACGHILAGIAEPVRVGDVECRVGASIGVAVYPTDGTRAETLLEHAEAALYRAKRAGRGGIVFYDESMNVEERQRIDLERELRQALARGQIEVQYQPRIDMATGRIVSAEALARWRHPQWGWIPPARFIPAAQECGLSESIGDWVMAQACQQVAMWRRAGGGIEQVSVNVSARQLRAGGLLDTVRHSLAKYDLPGAALELEVTESVSLGDVDTAVDVLSNIRSTGVTIALDDFGTGHSSLNYLRRLPVDVLKIDQSFVRDLADDPSARGIVQAIIAMARALQKSVTADGVESQAQADLLREWGCAEAQGNLFSKPLEASALTALLGRQARTTLGVLPGGDANRARTHELT